jgi:hypothetical protein
MPVVRGDVAERLQVLLFKQSSRAAWIASYQCTAIVVQNNPTIVVLLPFMTAERISW